MKRREIDELDGCVYDCPHIPGVWSDWCALGDTCDKFIKITDRYVWCKE